MNRIILAVSGGVDSSVAAWLLLQQGWEVIGVTFDLWREERPWSFFQPSSAIADARSVCEALGIEHRVIECREEFRRVVVDGFCAEYFRGRTPNPCTVCNPRIKFMLLAKLARELSAIAIATGHYARVEGPHRSGRYVLRKGAASGKEQSYVLYGLSQSQLSAARFPLGRWRKAEVRAQARKLGLRVHEKPDSQEICFIPDDDYGAFLSRCAPEKVRPGRIEDSSGKLLGRHAGVHRFTIGQRKGLGIAAGRPLYVLRIDPATATVVVGAREESFERSCLVQKVNWLSVPCPSGSIRALVRIRYAHAGAAALVEPLAGSDAVTVIFDEPQIAITPGQSAVFYEGDMVLGGGVIGRAW